MVKKIMLKREKVFEYRVQDCGYEIAVASVTFDWKLAKYFANNFDFNDNVYIVFDCSFCCFIIKAWLQQKTTPCGCFLTAL